MKRPFTTVVLGVLVGCQGVSRVTDRSAGDAGETGGSGNIGGATTGTGGGGEADSCSSAQPCIPGLVCGLDGKCRIPCSDSSPCPRNEHECIAQTCVSDGEVDRDAWDCPVGARRCSSSGDVVEACNATAPGFAPVEICPTWAPYCICPDEPCTNAFCGGCGAEFTSKFQVCATERDACLEDPGCEDCLGAGGEDCYEGGLWGAYMFCACGNIDMTEHPDVLECCYGWCYSEGIECGTSSAARCCPGLTCRNGTCAL